MRRVLSCAALALLSAPVLAQDRAHQPESGASAVAAAQRGGTPMVMTPPPVAADPSLAQLTRFSAAYQRARSPRIVIFWNRSLTDDVDTDRRNVTTTDSVTVNGERAASHAVSTWNGDYTASGRIAGEVSHSETTNETRRIDTGRRDTPNGETEDFDLERGFNDALSGAGARLVDRTIAMRHTALKGATDNVQAIEMKAIGGAAEIIVEVVPLDGPGQTSYKIVARRIGNGATLAALRSVGHVPERRMPYVAGPSGFVRALPPTQTAYQTGRQLAIETMATLSGRL